MQNEPSHHNMFPFHLASKKKIKSLYVRIAEKNKEIPLELPICYGTFVSMESSC